MLFALDIHRDVSNDLGTCRGDDVHGSQARILLCHGVGQLRKDASSLRKL